MIIYRVVYNYLAPSQDRFKSGYCLYSTWSSAVKEFKKQKNEMNNLPKCFQYESSYLMIHKLKAQPDGEFACIERIKDIYNV